MIVSPLMSGRPAPAQRGVALILVLVLLPLVAIIVTQPSFEATISSQLASNLLANQQFKGAVQARLAQMRLRLLRDLKDDEEDPQSAYDSYADLWGTDGGETGAVVRKGDREYGDEVTLYTEVYDEQGKFNLNLLTHNDAQRRGRAREWFVHLLDFLRDSRFGDLRENQWDLDPSQAAQIADAVVKLCQGEERDARIPKAKIPAPNANMQQGLYTVDDLIFADPLLREKRILETFTDIDTGQTMPGLLDFVTVYGDGRLNVNTAPIQVLRAMFREPEGQQRIAESIFHGRGGFLNTDEDADLKQEQEEERREYLDNEDEEGAQSLEQAYKNLNDIVQNVDGMNDQAMLRRNDIDVGRDFTVRTNFFLIVVTARRDNFLHQRRAVFQRHAEGTVTWETEVRTADLGDIPAAEYEEVEADAP